MRALADRLQHRLLPAVLAALGVSLVAAGLLSYSSPSRPRRTRRICRQASIDTPRPSAKSDLPPVRQPERGAERHVLPGQARRRDPGRGPGTRHRPAGHPPARRTERLPAVQRRDVPHRSSTSPANPARPTSTPTPGPGCSCRSSTASKINNGRRMHGHARPGLHHRRPALPVRDRRGPAPRHDPRRRARRDERDASGSRRPRARSGRSRRRRSSPFRSATARPTTRKPTRRRTRSTATEPGERPAAASSGRPALDPARSGAGRTPSGTPARS